MNSYQDYVTRMRKLADISGALATMHWDTEVYMPSGGASYRSRHIATLSGMLHELFIEPEFGDLLLNLKEDEGLSDEEHVNVIRTLEDYDQQKKLTREFVEKLSAARSHAFNRWVKAKEDKDFNIFSDALDTIVQLKREEAEMRGYESEPYDALLDTYEPDLRADVVESLFDKARSELLPIIQSLPKTPAPDFLHKNYPKDDQWDFGIDILKAFGYDFDRGRQDISAHPFTISFSPGDIRVTTRIDEYDLKNMTWSCMHEGGHALYEQGLREDHYGLPMAAAASLAIHESQSRLWENHVGRSLSFWKYWYPRLQQRFPTNLGEISLEEFYNAINHVAPNLIRTEADELHYHFHVMIRFEIERACMNGKVETAELRDLWNAKYDEYLQVDVPDDAAGILQDVHWSHGSFGYFPTYSIGSFYAAQFYAAANEAIPALEDQIKDGDLNPLLKWLRKEIHQLGRKYKPDELCRHVSGESLDVKHFIHYMREKLQKINAAAQV